MAYHPPHWTQTSAPAPQSSPLHMTALSSSHPKRPPDQPSLARTPTPASPPPTRHQPTCPATPPQQAPLLHTTTVEHPFPVLSPFEPRATIRRATSNSSRHRSLGRNLPSQAATSNKPPLRQAGLKPPGPSQPAPSIWDQDWPIRIARYPSWCQSSHRRRRMRCRASPGACPPSSKQKFQSC